MTHIKYDEKGETNYVSSDMVWLYRRGLVSKGLGEQIKKYLDEKKENK
jgi:hypothetical protein